MLASPSAPLEGRVIIITGAARGIGRALAEEASAAGATVVATDLDRPEFVRDRDIDARVVDVTREGAVQRLIDETIARHGRIHGVASCAGVMTLSPVQDLTPDEWRRTIDVHLTGQYLILRHAARAMASRGGGSVLLYSSHAAVIGSEAAAYSAAKAGVFGLVRSAARTLRSDGILVNAILPGAATRMTDAIHDAHLHAAVPGLSVRSSEAAGTWRDPRNTAAAAMYLLSGQNTRITGQLFAVVGDQVARLEDPKYVDKTTLRTGLEDARGRFDEAAAAFAAMDPSHIGPPDVAWPPAG